MSKLSIHISDNPTGLDPLLLKCAQANSPISVIYSLNQNIADSIRRNSPGTRWIYRRQTGTFERLPPDWWQGDPEQNARRWLTETKDPADRHRTQVENWGLNHADWYDPLNEPAIEIAEPDNPAQVADAVRKAQWLNTWMMTALNIADGLGFKLALFSFPTGSPPLVTWKEVNTSQLQQVPSNPECQSVVWHYLLPALRHGKQSGAVLSLHAYWEDRDPSVDHRDALRYRDLMSILPADARLPIVISEASSGNGYGISDIKGRGQPWIDDMARWDAELMKDPIILAGCAFQLGQGVESAIPLNVLEKYGDYISAHPTPGEPAHIAPPPKTSAEGTSVPPRPTITASAGLGSPVQVNGQSVVFGIHGNADLGDLPPRDLSIMQLVAGRVTGYKFLTGHSVSHYNTIIHGVQIPAENCMTRLFMDMEGRDEPPTPDEFVKDMTGAIQDAWNVGIRWYELHNEPNLFKEWKESWGGPARFVEWAKQVIDRLKSRPEWDGIKIVSPGLSPHGDDAIGQHTDRWIDVFATGGLFAVCDAVGAHAYWGKREEMLDLKDLKNGLNFHRYFARTDKPIWLTEFSNNQPFDSNLDKGKQYLEYLNYLRQNEPRVKRAYCFVLSGRAFDNSKETWARDDSMADIPAGVMV